MMGVMSFLLVFVLGLTSMFGGGGFQQDGFFCGDLPEADCAILQQAQDAMLSVESLAWQMDGEITVGGLEEMMPGAQSLAFTFDLNGAFAGDPATILALQEAYTLMQPDLTDPQASAEAVALYEDFFNTTTLQMEMSLGLPPILMATDPTVPESISMEMRMVDGIFYFLMPEEPGLPAEWQGIDLSNYSEFYEQALGQASDQGAPQDMEDLQAMMDAMADYQALLLDADFINQFVTVERLDDETMMGQSMAVFQMSYDYGAMFSDERYIEALTNYLNVLFSASVEPGMPDESLAEEDIQVLTTLVQLLYQDATSTMTLWVGLNDHLVHQTQANVAFTINLLELVTQISEMTGDPAPPASEMPFEQISLDYTLTATFSDYNQPVTVEVPPDAEVIDPLEMMTEDAMPSS